MVSMQIKARLDEALRLCQAGTLPEDEGICRDILAHHAQAGDAWNLLAMILHHRGELNEAALAADRAITLHPENPQYLMIRGGIAQASIPASFSSRSASGIRGFRRCCGSSTTGAAGSSCRALT